MAAEDDSEIPDTGAVFTFGKSKFADNLPNKFWVRNDFVRDVACGDEHTALVAESGRVFTFGSNDWGQLGLGTSQTADRPCCIKSLKTEKVKLVACGRVHTIVATESGKLYSFGANGENQLGVEDSPACNVPKCIDSIVTQQYKMLAAGADHSVAVTDDGCVYVWGSGSEGQLGLGGRTECPEPEELRIEDRVICISCGYYHTAIVTDTGDLYTFGENEGGKLGLGDDPDETDTPQRVSIPDKVKAVVCGGSHTVALTESGTVYTFGEGASGQLGHGTHCLQISTPRKLDVKFKVSSIACGESHTSIISEKGHQYTFGDGRHGKLALGQDSFSNQFIPSMVQRFLKFEVQKVSCGGCHMICLAKRKLENGHMSSSEDEMIKEPKLNGLLNHTLRADGSIDLNNSVTARDRRRKHNDSFKNDLNRTLPALAGAKLPQDHLHMTVPPGKSRRLDALPPSHTTPLPSKTKSESEESEVDEEIKAETVERTESSKPLPVPRKLPSQLKHEDEETESEEEEEEEEEHKEITETKRSLPMAPIPQARPQPKVQTAEFDSEEKDVSEEEEEDTSKKKKKKKDKKKKGSLGIFGRKKTGISDDEDDDDDEEKKDTEDESEEKDKKGKDKKGKKDKKDKKKDKKDKKKKGKDEEEAEDKDVDEEEEDVKDKKKDKKEKKKDKDNKDKKKDKKDKKKGKKDEEEESEEEEEEEKEKEDKKKDKKKEKDKKKDKKKDKDKDKEVDTEDEKSGDDKEAGADGDKDDKKKDDKPVEPPKKKSRTCTIL